MSSGKSKSFQLFGLPIYHPVNLILITNIIFYILQVLSIDPITHSSIIEQNFALRPYYAISGMYWQVFTYGFLHSTMGFSGIFHIGMNMYGFYALSRAILPIVGSLKIVSAYFLSQLGGGLMVVLNSIFLNYLSGSEILGEYKGNGIFLEDGTFINFDIIPTLGASGAVFGLLAIFSRLFPVAEIYIFFFKIQARYIVWVSILIGFALERLLGVMISNAGHLGGALVGYAFFDLFIKPSLPELIRSKSDFISEVMKSTVSTEDINRKVLDKLSEMDAYKKKEDYLLPLQVEDANICPPFTYNPKDPFCIQCEWLVNCALRKAAEEKNKKDES